MLRYHFFNVCLQGVCAGMFQTSGKEMRMEDSPPPWEVFMERWWNLLTRIQTCGHIYLQERMGNTVPPRAKEEEEMRISKLPQSLPVCYRAYYLFHDLYKYASSALINLVALIDLEDTPSSCLATPTLDLSPLWGMGVEMKGKARTSLFLGWKWGNITETLVSWAAAAPWLGLHREQCPGLQEGCQRRWKPQGPLHPHIGSVCVAATPAQVLVHTDLDRLGWDHSTPRSTVGLHWFQRPRTRAITQASVAGPLSDPRMLVGGLYLK